MSKLEKKVSTPLSVGAVAVVLVWVAGLFGVDMPAEVAAGIVVVLGAVSGYFAPHTHRDDVDAPTPAAD